MLFQILLHCRIANGLHCIPFHFGVNFISSSSTRKSFPLYPPPHPLCQTALGHSDEGLPSAEQELSPLLDLRRPPGDAHPTVSAAWPALLSHPSQHVEPFPSLFTLASTWKSCSLILSCPASRPTLLTLRGQFPVRFLGT